MVLLRRVTPAVMPKARPGDRVAFVSRLVCELATRFPRKCAPPLMVTAVPVAQKIRQASDGGPPMTTAVALSMTVSAVAIWMIHTAFGSPLASKVSVVPAI